ncbi:MAG: hypothetical protein EXS31_08865 [Pedosphaera sp.]|nr:hypothetical protein [Pedosphaera sp.]
MTPANVQARKATVDDLSALRKLWHVAGLPIDALEKRLREFQILETPNGELLGAVGLLIEGQQGLLHSETYSHPEFEAELRSRIWERVQTVVRNHGLLRLWTTNTSTFWKSEGFQIPSEAQMSKCPPASDEVGPWFVLKLREEMPVSASLDQEFQLFTQAQRENSERMIRQARLFKNLAYAVLLILAVLGLLLAVLAVLPNSAWSQVFKKPPPVRPRQKQQPQGPAAQGNSQPDTTPKPWLAWELHGLPVSERRVPEGRVPRAAILLFARSESGSS